MAEPSTEGQAQPGEAALEVSDFANLLQKEFKPKSDKAKEAVETAVEGWYSQRSLRMPMLPLASRPLPPYSQKSPF